MRKFAIASTVAITSVLFIWLVFGEEISKEESPHRAIVVIEAVHSRDGVGQLTAISIVDRKKIEALEQFFPNYRKCPSSDQAAGWILGATIYFDFNNGRSIRVGISQNEDMKWWTVGKGDFEVRGDFSAYLKHLCEIGPPDSKRP